MRYKAFIWHVNHSIYFRQILQPTIPTCTDSLNDTWKKRNIPRHSSDRIAFNTDRWMLKFNFKIAAEANNSLTMKYVILLCVVLCCVFAQEEVDTTGLKIDVVSPPPADCTRKTKKHDLLVLHYEGFYENGTKFDSRYDYYFCFLLSWIHETKSEIIFVLKHTVHDINVNVNCPCLTN